MRLMFGALVAVAVVWSACSDGGDDGVAYVSLGDSIGAGYGASDPPATGFAALVAAERGLNARNLATVGATTATVIEHQLAEAMPLVEAGAMESWPLSLRRRSLSPTRRTEPPPTRPLVHFFSPVANSAHTSWEPLK